MSVGEPSSPFGPQTKLPAERPCVSQLALALASVLWQAPQRWELPSPPGEFEPSQHRRRRSSAGGDPIRHVRKPTTNHQGSPNRRLAISPGKRGSAVFEMRWPRPDPALTSSQGHTARVQLTESARVERAVPSGSCFCLRSSQKARLRDLTRECNQSSRNPIRPFFSGSGGVISCRIASKTT